MSKETEYKEVIYRRNEDVIISVICDGCGKEEKKLPDDWHEFAAYHNAWGNDSIDSYEYYHACSGNCYIKALKKAVEEFEENKNSAEIDNFDYDFAKQLSEVKK